MSKISSFVLKNCAVVHNIVCKPCVRWLSTSNICLVDKEDSHQNSNNYFKNMSEEYLYQDESLDRKRARLHWQSRKRGISETCLIFSTFSSKHLNSFLPDQVNAYDRLLNEPSNDWDIYYWMVGHKPVPKEYDNEVMKMLQHHCRNENKEKRYHQPELNYTPVQVD